MSAKQRVKEYLGESKEADPHAVAAVLSASLSTDEREELVFDGLVYLIRKIISESRGHTGGSIRSLRPLGDLTDEEVKQEIEKCATWTGAARELNGGNIPGLRRVCSDRGIVPDFQQKDDEREAAFQLDMAGLVSEFADAWRAEGIQIGLEQAERERVCVGGRWTFLADCTPEDLRILSDEYTDRATQNAQQGAYYRALADEVESAGRRTVRDYCELQVAR